MSPGLASRTAIRAFSQSLILLAGFLFPSGLHGQTEDAAPYRLYGGVTYFSNSFNGLPGARKSLLGWEAAAAFPSWRGLRFKLDVSGTTGDNRGAQQHAFFVLGGGEYAKKLGRERVFAHALLGDAGLNRYWGPNASPGMTSSFAVLLGGGVDTPISRHFSVRAQGDMQHTNFALVQSVKDPFPYRVPGLPNFSGRFSTGFVWTPRIRDEAIGSTGAGISSGSAVQSELITEYRSSFGHYHIYAGTWWSYLHLAGVEYDRHTWGQFMKARLDYVADIQPLVILRQPSKADTFGDPLSRAHETVPGMEVSPIGVRMLWRDGRSWKPYYTAKGGLVVFTHKALSPAATYENFSLQQSTGIQFRLSDRWDVRTGISDFHFSNGFLVPSNPGIDEMMYSIGLSYHLQPRSAAVR